VSIVNVLENSQIQEWLAECRSINTRRSYESNIKRFFAWYNKPIEDFLALDSKEMRHNALKFQNEHPNMNPNSVIGVLVALNSFLQYLDMPINFKGKRVRPRPDLNSHNFSNGDLAKMFEIANTKQKALLALSCSLGWEVSAVLELDGKTLSGLVDRAKSENQQFIYFISQRHKTGAARLGVLNPLCLEWLGKWLTESKGMLFRKRKSDKKTKDRVVSEVFDITAEGANKIIRTLARQAGIVTTGRIHFHKLRGWVMSGLSRAGFNEFQIKYLMGKAIPLTDMTYLQTLQQEIEERYPEAYEHYLCLKPNIQERLIKDVTRQASQEIEKLKEERDVFKARLERIEKFMDEHIQKQQETLRRTTPPFGHNP